MDNSKKHFSGKTASVELDRVTTALEFVDTEQETTRASGTSFREKRFR
jgi:hypothetical protein